MSTSTIAPTFPIHRLYAVRAVAAIVWAALLTAVGSADGVATGESVSSAVVALLIAYPLIDAVATLAEIRIRRPSAPTPLVVNAIISVITAIVLGASVSHGSDAALRVFGVWALVTGLIQLTVATLRRRRSGLGQLPMMLSGFISSLAGIAFVQMSTMSEPKLTVLAGYAVAGAVFFLISAWRLRSQQDA